METDGWRAAWGSLEAGLGLPRGLTASLLEGDHWSLVVTAHAIVECALTDLLLRTSDARLATVMRTMGFGGGRSTKLAAVDALAVFDSRTLEFVRKLTDLRNALLADTGAFRFDFAEFLPTLTLANRGRWGSVAAAAVAVDGEEAAERFASRFPLLPGPVIVLGAYAVLARSRGDEPEEGDASSPLEMIHRLAVALSSLPLPAERRGG